MHNFGDKQSATWNQAKWIARYGAQIQNINLVDLAAIYGRKENIQVFIRMELAHLIMMLVELSKGSFYAGIWD